MSKQDDLIKARIPKDLKDAVRRKAKAERLSLSQVMRQLLAGWLRGDALPPPEH